MEKKISYLILSIAVALTIVTAAFLLRDQTGAQAAGDSCAGGGIASASIDRSLTAPATSVTIQGQASLPGPGSVSVSFDGTSVGLLPIDAAGNFHGSVTVPAAATDGGHSFNLVVNSCVRQRLVLFVGDSVTEGSFASSPQTAYASLVLDGLRQRYGRYSWNMQVYGVSGYGSLILDDSFNTPFYLNSLNPPPYFSPRSWWKNAQPDLVVIELGVNNLPGMDSSYRYDGTLRGYASDEEALAWWKTDATSAVNFLTTQKGVPASHILILGQWPFGGIATYRGERYQGGAQEAVWDNWNTEMQATAQTLGSTFVPMADVYGAGYIPDDDVPGGDYQHLVDHDHGESEVHPNDAGMAMFASRILQTMPADVNGPAYSLPIETATVSPVTLRLRLSYGRSSWASYSDYIDRWLSVDFILSNEGGDDALGAQMLQSVNSDNVLCVSPMPYEIGDIPAGSLANFTLRYEVPPGVTFFRTVLKAEAGDTYGWRHEFP
ncbi:MAG: SGNH/GDSL hydrolase family protein [Thermoleophilia bacterium]